MRVDIIKYSDIYPVVIACRTCYNSRSKTDSKPNSIGAKDALLISKVISSGHMSVLEHWSATFNIEGISRACSHQLVRHRIASFSQQSQRYVALGDNTSFVIPPTVQNNPKALVIFSHHLASIHDQYAQLTAMGIPPEDARYLLPNATETSLIMTMNARELLHFFELRCCNRAQWEIREMANKMLCQLKTVAPIIFKNAGPACVSQGQCPEGDLSCRK